jgi:hypothetical protein
MTTSENRQRIKNEALNAIRKIYDPKHKNIYSVYTEMDGCYAEQREQSVRDIIEKMERELKSI